MRRNFVATTRLMLWESADFSSFQLCLQRISTSIFRNVVLMVRRMGGMRHDAKISDVASLGLPAASPC